MLFSVSLAARFADKGLISVSLHPGVIYTNLSSHLENTAWPELGASYTNVDLKFLLLLICFKAEIGRNLALPRFGGFNAKSQQQGVATYVFAAFHESVSMQSKWLKAILLLKDKLTD